MKNRNLFDPVAIGEGTLRNRIVMAPMTRCRATGNIPNELMAEYYRQRSGAGLIITEGTAPSANGLGYARIPGIFTSQQEAGWEKVTRAVHGEGGKIILQLMHCGRISHPLNMPSGSRVIAPSAIQPAGQMWTDEEQLQDYPVPEAMTEEDISTVKSEYVRAAQRAISAGFDGVELHGANGYLLEQFLSPVSNIREDGYGGSITNRCRFVLEVADAVSAVIGKDKTGIRLSPYGVAGDMPKYPETDPTYHHLTKELNKLGISYIHLVDHASMGAPVVPFLVKKMIRRNFSKTLIVCGGYDLERAKDVIEDGIADLVAFGRPFINNPDLVERFINKWPLAAEVKPDLFYTGDDKGYTDYPVHQEEPVTVSV